MTTRSVMLQKKLHELETELTAVFRLPLTDLRRLVSFDDIEQRFTFLENLLAAEINGSQPESSDQLHDIGGRLTALKTAFRDWKETINSSNFNNHDDTLSICSDCTQALVYCDDVCELGSPLISEADKFAGEKSPEKVAPVALAMAEEEEEEEEKIWCKMGKYCGVFGCGMIVGAICAVNLVSSAADFFIQYEAFLIPPT